jgi:hypothetical protein
VWSIIAAEASYITIDVEENHKLISATVHERLGRGLTGARCPTPPDAAFSRRIRSAFRVCGNHKRPAHLEGIYKFASITHNDVNRVAIVTDNPVIFAMARTYTICANWNNIDRVTVFRRYSRGSSGYVYPR